MVIASNERSRLSLAGMSLYEEYITGLIYIRNELERLASWPKGKDRLPLPFSISSPQDVERTMAALRSMSGDCEHHAQQYFRKSWQPANAPDVDLMKRPPGLPTLPADDGLVQRLLRQVEELLTDLCPSPDALS